MYDWNIITFIINFGKSDIFMTLELPPDYNCLYINLDIILFHKVLYLSIKKYSFLHIDPITFVVFIPKYIFLILF